MSAGTGVMHSERNKNLDQPVKFLQIWVFPKERDIEPRYDQKLFSADERQSQFQNVVSPVQSDGGVWINQDAWFWLGDFKAGQPDTYTIKRSGNGTYVLVLEGAVAVAGEQLERRDGMGIEDTASVEVDATEDCQLLVMDVPM